MVCARTIRRQCFRNENRARVPRRRTTEGSPFLRLFAVFSSWCLFSPTFIPHRDAGGWGMGLMPRGTSLTDSMSLPSTLLPIRQARSLAELDPHRSKTRRGSLSGVAYTMRRDLKFVLLTESGCKIPTPPSSTLRDVTTDTRMIVHRFHHTHYVHRRHQLSAVRSLPTYGS